MEKKNKIAISVFAALSVVSGIVGYSLINQNESYKYGQLAVMVKQSDGTYIKSNMSAFENDDYDFDHAVCNNGSSAEANLNGGVNLKLIGADKCTVYLSSKPQTVTEKIKKYAQSTTPDFNSVSAAKDARIYSMQDDYGTSYYFRGNVENNYVKFGDFYWRIVRLNGDGSLRIIYDGTTPHANGEESPDRTLTSTIQFNEQLTNPYVGYMYGSGSTYATAHANTNDSTIKKFLDSWYEENIENKGLSVFLSDTLFCNDRSLVKGTGLGTNMTYYGAYERLINQKAPSLICPQQQDAFTVSDTVKGNGALTYPVGLLTADEYVLSGGRYAVGNIHTYLYKGSTWWLGTPDHYSIIFGGGPVGQLTTNPITDNYAVVPVINLTAEYTNQLVGSGTMKDPYREPITKKIKASAKESTSTMFSAAEPTNTISNVTDDNFSKDEQTYTVDATHQNYYMTYASAYTFNSPTIASSGSNYPSYTLTSPQVAKYSDIYESLVGKYIVNYEGHNSSTAAYSGEAEYIDIFGTAHLTRVGVNRIYKVVSATATSITYIPSSYTIEFTNNGTTGVYTAEDDYGTSYYFRGNVTDNYVRFGKWTEEVYRGYNEEQSYYREYFTKEECQADGTYKYDCNKSPVAGKDMYWRIVRINGDGSLRLMYDGTEAHANGTRSWDRTALTYQQFNNGKDNNAYIGYMYGDTAGTTYDAVHKNTHNSAIKIALETWYEKNFVGTEYEIKIGDMSFCNDRSIVPDYSGTIGTGIGTNSTYYGASGRLKINKSPSLVCPQKANDLFTSDATIQGGNGKLNQPVGLLTADEAALAGGVNGLSNRGYYINKGNFYWLGSPSDNGSSSANGFYIYDVLSFGSVKNTNAASPVINLSNEYANKLAGSGTMDDPYHF